MTSRTQSTFPPPVMEARRWIAGKTFDDQPLLNLSQAAPVDPPHPELMAEMARVILEENDTHLYGPVLGLPGLRQEVAAQWTSEYEGKVAPENVAITSGCNQAFAATIAALCSEGDNIIVPVPFYFNHKMWLDMAGVDMQALACGADLVPDAEMARSLITPKTRAIALVTPNNPSGVEYPKATIKAFYDVARDAGIKLIVDETYRDFHSQEGKPHDLFLDADWAETLVQLYSFSKSFRLTGHRVGAIVTSQDLLAEIEKFLDTVTICPNQLGQKAALWGMQNLKSWLAGERQENLARRAAIQSGFHVLEAKGWKLLGCGAYFAYTEHPYDMPSNVLAEKLVDQASVLILPGTMFVPEGDPNGERQVRIAFANADVDGISEMFNRLSSVNL